MLLTPSSTSKQWPLWTQINDSEAIINTTENKKANNISETEFTSQDLLESEIKEIAKEILESNEVKEKLKWIQLNGIDTKIPNIGNYDLWSTIRDEYKKIMKYYRRFHEGRTDSFDIFKKTLNDIADKGIFSEEFEKYSNTIEEAATSKNKKKFIARTKPIAEMLTIARITSRKTIANIRYENNKEKNLYLKEWSPRNYDITENDWYNDGIFVPKNTIEAHIEYYAPKENEDQITKVILEGFQIIKWYLFQHPECPWVLMSSRLIYSIIKEKPRIAERVWIKNRTTSIDEKAKHATTFIDRETFLNQKTIPTIQPL